jgi:hypothetical protein
VQLPHFVDRHGIKIEFLAHPTAFSRVRFEGSVYSVATRIFKRGQVRYPTRQMTGLPSKHSNPRILTLAGQVGACISGTMSATIVPSAVCTAGGAVFVFRPPGSGAGRDRSLQSRIRPPSAGIPPANLGFRLVAEPSQSVATSVVRNVTKLLQ